MYELNMKTILIESKRPDSTSKPPGCRYTAARRVEDAFYSSLNWELNLKSTSVLVEQLDKEKFLVQVGNER